MNQQNQLIVRGMDDVSRIAQMIAASGMFRDIRDASQAGVKIVAGVELGIPPMAALAGVHIVDGKPTLGSNLIAGKIMGSGTYKYKVLKKDAKGCELEFLEKEGDNWVSVGKSSFNEAKAKAAGLLSKKGDMYKKYPESMYFSRALTDGARTYCPHIFTMPVYTPEELDQSGTIDTEGQVIDVTPKEESKKEAVKPQEKPKDEEKPKETKGESTDNEPEFKTKHKAVPSGMSKDQKRFLENAVNTPIFTTSEKVTIMQASKGWNEETAEDRIKQIKTQREQREQIEERFNECFIPGLIEGKESENWKKAWDDCTDWKARKSLTCDLETQIEIRVDQSNKKGPTIQDAEIVTDEK